MKICNTTIKRKNNEDRDMSIITQKNSRQKKFVSGLAQYLDFSPEVRKAKKNKAPLVALESTIIAHGMPYPQNLATAQAVEKIVRQNGATPATIAILEGKIKIGLTSDELKQLASSPDVAKVSRRDMATIITCKNYSRVINCYNISGSARCCGCCCYRPGKGKKGPTTTGSAQQRSANTTYHCGWA